MLHYLVEPVVCDYGVYELRGNDKTLVVICNSQANALKIADILNDDAKHKVYKECVLVSIVEHNKIAGFLNNIGIEKVTHILPHPSDGEPWYTIVYKE